MKKEINPTTKNAAINQRQAYKILASLLVGLFASVSLFVFFSLRYYDDNLYVSTGNSIFAAIKNACSVASSKSIYIMPLLAVFFLAVSVIFFFYFRHKTKVNKFIFRYRYAIALVVLTFCVVFELNGSSIGIWASALPDGSNSGLLLGDPRGCRTDEYALFTGLTFASYYDPQGSWPYFGEVLRAKSTDMFMVHGQAVLDPAIIFRPYQIGFLMLGLSRGISFFWFSRLIALFMTSFELGRVITKDNRGLSLAFAFLVALAPVISWWFSLNNFVEMLVFFNVIIICLNAYTKVEGALKRRLLIAAIAYCCVGYIYSIYPAWQVPAAYVLFALVIPIIYKNKSEFARAIKADWHIISLCALAAICCTVGIAYHSIDAITSEMNTDYPGSRVEVGGGGFLLFFRYPISLFLSFIPASGALSGLTGNCSPDNITTFFDLCPLGIILAIVNTMRAKKVNPTTLALLIVIVFLGVYCAVGFPETLAKLTLMGKSMTTRAIVIFSFANLNLLFHEIARFKPVTDLQSKVSSARNQSSRFKRSFTPKNTTAVFVCIVACLALCLLCKFYEVSFVDKAKFAIIFAVLLCVWLSVAFGKQRALVSVCVIIAIISGAFVNPVQRGIDCVDKNPVITEIRGIAQANKGAKWVVAAGWKSNMMLFAGAPTINTMNLYPNPDLWAVLDPNSERKADWNRCAHIHSKIVSEDEGSSFEKKDIYLLQVNFTLSSLRALDVEFMAVEGGEISLTDKELNQLDLISTIGNFKIYSIK